MRGEGMVQQMFGRPIIGVWRARHQNDRKVLGIGAANRIQGRERAYAKGDDAGRSPIGAGVSLGAEAAVQFVAAVDLSEVLSGQELIEQRCSRQQLCFRPIWDNRVAR